MCKYINSLKYLNTTCPQDTYIYLGQTNASPNILYDPEAFLKQESQKNLNSRFSKNLGLG